MVFYVFCLRSQDAIAHLVGHLTAKIAVSMTLCTKLINYNKYTL